MTPEQAVAELDRLATEHNGDPEAARTLADTVLLATVPPEVCDAYERVMAACSWWAAV